MNTQHQGTFGERNGMATAPFAEVELARALHRDGMKLQEIAEKLEQNYETIKSWVYYRTRAYS